jgi:hypothetical protein
MSKIVIASFFCFLLLPFLGASSLAEIPTHNSPSIIGILIDEELAGLLKKIIPYNAPQKDALPKEKRFLFNLNKLINEDLAKQGEAYRLHICKLALRQALAINRMVDSIEVRRYATRTKEPSGDFSGDFDINIKGDF